MFFVSLFVSFFSNMILYIQSAASRQGEAKSENRKKTSNLQFRAHFIWRWNSSEDTSLDARTV